MHYIEKEWKEGIRSKGLYLTVLVMAVISVGVLWKSSNLDFAQGFYVLVLNLFESFVYLVTIISLFMGAFSIFQEKEQKTFVMIITKQDSFGAFFWKKSLAVQSLLLVPVLGWFFFFLIPIKFYFHIEFAKYFSFLLAMSLLVFIFTQIGLALGSVLTSKIQVIGTCVLVWFYFFFAHDFLLLSVLEHVHYDNVHWFSTAFFLNPLQAARVFLESSIGVYSFGHLSKLLQSFLWLPSQYFFIFSGCFYLFLTTMVVMIFHRKEGYQ